MARYCMEELYLSASPQKVKIECIDKLGVLLSKPKRVKILVGGRASTKSTFVADYVLAKVAEGERACCAREYQSSIDDSVHAMLSDEIERCGFVGFKPLRSEINHASGGKAFYKGLARNVTSLKGINARILWIEEGESLSVATIKVLTASIRVSAKDAQAAREAGEDMPVPEIWITMNRGSALDPIAVRFLKRAESELERCGYYEDDMVMIVDVNYDENPWFHESGLESERADDYANMTRAEYDHKWLGKYNDTVENAIIPAEWFDAAIDAHITLGFEPRGCKVVSHDPSDMGPDDKATGVRHGSVITEAELMTTGDVNTGMDWATGMAIDERADLFTWDCDGMGAALRLQANTALAGKKIELHEFKGSQQPDRPNEIYQDVRDIKNVSSTKKPKTNKQTFKNKRAQYYWMLRDRFYKTWLAVEKLQYIDSDELISISSGLSKLDQLRSEVCRVPRKHNANGMIQIMSKPEMSKLGIASPNLADQLMMSLVSPDETGDMEEMVFTSAW